MANKQTGGTRLTGINPLAYMGTEPASPPQLVRYQQQPTNRDFGFNLGTIWIVDEPFQMYMLSEKPQNVAVWRLIYPQGNAGGISLITTDNGDVAADVNGEIQMNGGENINIAAGTPDQVVVNLNRTIRWPATNMAATEGIIFLDGDRFIHNYGPNGNTDTNTFIGVNSGNFTLTGIGNTACGNQSLESLTSGRENSAVGSLSLSSLTTGISNCALGVGAGGNLTNGDSLNICINNFGTAGDTGITRIGTEGDQTDAYMAGIYNAVIDDTTSHAVFVDSTGKLGAGESNFGASFSQPFLGIQQIYTGNIWPGGNIDIANYALGSAAPMVEQYDIGNNFFAGDGAGTGVITNPATFTAPATGIYHFRITVAFGDSLGNNNDAPTDSKLSGIAINGILFYWYPERLSGGAIQNVFYNEWDVSLTINDVVTFVLNAAAAANTGGIVPTFTNNNTFGPILNVTTVSGYRIA